MTDHIKAIEEAAQKYASAFATLGNLDVTVRQWQALQAAIRAGMQAQAELIADMEAEIASLSARVQEVGAIGRREHVKAQALEAELAAMRAVGEPYAFAVHFPNDSRIELVHDLDALVEDMTNNEYVVTALYTHAQPAAQAGEDAARYLFLRDEEWRDTDLEPVIRLQLNSLWDTKIDAARKQGATP